jgi:spore germination protein KB
MIGGGVKTGILIFGAALGITQIFKLDDYKPLVIPIVTFSVLLSVWVYPSRGEMARWATDVYPYYSISFELTIPLLLLIVSLIRKKINKNS